uniref:Protein kinase domain-containing protein n=1 Tax=Oryza punctata TaxID=4537 RepID=A0A0E0MMI3_ORYPU
MAASSSDFAAAAKIEEVTETECVRAADDNDIAPPPEEKEKLAAEVEEKEEERAKAAWEIDLSRVHIRAVVWHGSRSTVYRAEYGGQDVAVKVLDLGKDGLTAAEEEIARLEEHLAVWHGLPDHPNVARLVGASIRTTGLKIPGAATPPDDTAARCVVVVEFVSGRTLRAHLMNHHRRKLPYMDVLRLAQGMALGLSYLHANGIVHGCVTTDNMLLLLDDVKIPDFGRVVSTDQMTAETAVYMAPEVFDGKPYDEKCDVYSFGMCLWEVYCCEAPLGDVVWRGVVEVAAHARRRSGSGRPRLPMCCPGDLATLMERCWDADPERRPGMDEVVSRFMMLEALDETKDWGMKPEKTPGCIGFLFGCGYGGD